MRLKEYVRMNDDFYKRLEIRKVGRNNRNQERVLLYATEGTDLHDYAVCIMDDEEIGIMYRFPRESVMGDDGYICLFVDNGHGQVFVNDRQAKIFSMNCGDGMLDNKSVCLIKISKTVYKSVERE